MLADEKIDLVTSIGFLLLTLLISGVLLPDFGREVASFVTKKLDIVTTIFIVAFLVALFSRVSRKF